MYILYLLRYCVPPTTALHACFRKQIPAWPYTLHLFPKLWSHMTGWVIVCFLNLPGLNWLKQYNCSLSREVPFYHYVYKHPSVTFMVHAPINSYFPAWCCFKYICYNLMLYHVNHWVKTCFAITLNILILLNLCLLASISILLHVYMWKVSYRN